MNAYLYRLLVVFSYCFFAAISIVGCFYLQEVLRRRKEKRLMIGTVENILEAKRWDHRQRWIDDETMEYLYLILGEGTKEGRQYVWAIVTIGRTYKTVTLRHLDLGLLNVSAHSMVKDCIADLVKPLEERGATVKVEAVLEQPDMEMLFAKE